MTYHEVAQELINLYANYIEVCTANEENYSDFSEELVIAVEALLIRADQEKMNALNKNVISHLSAVAPIPDPSIQKYIEQENAFDRHVKWGDD